MRWLHSGRKARMLIFLIADMGDPDRVFDYLDQVEVIMRREPWEKIQALAGDAVH